ncbi:MAG: thermonuclease family protein [Burkholderiales bacterium]|jgi:micrococcal nuclease
MKTNWKSVPVITMLVFLALSGHASVVHAKKSKDKTVTGVVTKVSDGDTLWLRPDRCEAVGECPLMKLRIQGMDAPEVCQDLGEQSAAALRSRVLNQKVTVSLSSQDRYGRELGRVRLNDDDVGAWMVRQGWAWSYRYKHNAGPYTREEQQAREAQRGVFADPAAIEPRAFRQSHGPCRYR